MGSSGNILVEIFVVFLLIIFSPVLSRLFKIPVIVIEILLGVLLGPSFLGLLEEVPWLSAMALIGFIYLMFVVGLEIEVGFLKARFLNVVAMALGSFLTPLVLGYLVALHYELPPEFIGVALSTTSMGIVLPTVKEFSHRTEVAQILLGAAVLVDVMSMFALAYIVEKTFLSPDKLLLLLISIVGFILVIFFLKNWEPARSKASMLVGEYHLDVRLSIALIFGLAVLAEIIGIHAILGSFFAGLLISELREKVEKLVEKLLSFGYGFFIPIFFITVGVRTDLGLILGNIRGIEILIALLSVGFIGKIFGTFIVSKFSGFTKYESLSIGFAMSARLSLIIASAELGLAAGLITHEIYSMLVLLAIISVLLSPSLAKLIMGKEVLKVPEETPIP